MPSNRHPPFNNLPLQSVVPHLKYPALSDPRVLPIIAYLYQLERAQWMDPSHHRGLVLSQLDELLRTAFEKVPYYHEALGACGYDATAPLDDGAWARVPILTRQALQENGMRLRSTDIPHEMQPFKQTKSSGSTGMPVEVFQPATKSPMMYATAALEPLIHGADFMGKTASIRYMRSGEPQREAARAPDWGPPLSIMFPTGPAVTLSSETDPEAQADWVMKEDPAYLQMFPSNLEALLPILEARGAELPGLHYFRTMGEQLPDRIRETVRSQLGRKIVDAYSTQEVGLIAMQCPETDHYHLVQDMVFTEILRDDGSPCDAGEIGRVVVTDLFNPAFPLIRYEVGDFAEMGAPCPCGRAWPVITRVMGRVRNLITYPDGRREWPSSPGKPISSAVPMTQYQIVQSAPDRLHVKLVMKRPLTEDDRASVTAIVHERLGEVFKVSVEEVETIPRGASGKYEEFKSELV